MATDTNIDETHRLIASNKVEGTTVYNRHASHRQNCAALIGGRAIAINTR